MILPSLKEVLIFNHLFPARWRGTSGVCRFYLVGTRQQIVWVRCIHASRNISIKHSGEVVATGAEIFLPYSHTGHFPRNCT